MAVGVKISTNSQFGESKCLTQSLSVGGVAFFLCPFLLLTGVAVCLDFLFVFGGYLGCMSFNSFRFLLFPKY